MLNLTPDEGIDSIFETTSQMDVQTSTTVAPLLFSTPTLTLSTIATISTVPQAPTPPITASSTLMQDMPNFGSLFGFDHQLKILEANFFEFVQTNQLAGVVSSIPEIDEGDDDDDQEEGNDDDQDSDEEGKEFIHPMLSIHDEEETKDDESFDPIAKTPENTDDEDELYRDVNTNLEGRVIQMVDVHTTQEFKDSHVTLTPVNLDGQQHSSFVLSQFVTSMLNLTPDEGIDSIFETTSQMDVQTSTTVAPLPFSTPTLTLSTIATI
nr:hypothetical protein [Tanacetum cinerariifolium]